MRVTRPSFLRRLSLPTSPPTTSLPLPGGCANTSLRASEHARIALALKTLPLPPHGRLHPRDILWASPDVALVGVGAATTWPGLHAALAADVFRTRRVVAVRDVFDRSPSRLALAHFCALPARHEDVLAVERAVVADPAARRLINEYSREKEGDRYRMVRNDEAFVSWAHHNGFRLLPVDGAEALEKARGGDVPVQQSSNHCLVVAPCGFEFNEEAAVDNHFMHSSAPEGGDVQSAVLREFAGLHARLTDLSGVGAVVHCFTAEGYHSTPDALFPNNTFRFVPRTLGLNSSPLSLF